MPERHLGRHLGRFRVDSIIGSGGFAWVYKGYDPELDIPVAIKVLKPQFAGEDAFEQRFRLEASTAARLRHPNIIRILAVGREDQAVFFVMDYLPTALDDRLRIMGTLPESLLIRLGLDVSAALAFAHREGVIHRDIKTDNVLFDEHGNAIVADFGIARAVSGYTAQTGTNMVVGTPQYFSPEQARGLPLDGRSDIYALGVTLFKAATGVLPFQGDDWYDIARQHVEEPPPKPRSLNPSISRGVERVILKCLEKDPVERYATSDALQGDLAQLLGMPTVPDADATVVLRTPVSGERARAALAPSGRGGGRRSLAIAFIAGVAAIALVAFAVRHRDAAPPSTAVGFVSPHVDTAHHEDSATAPDSSTLPVIPAAPAARAKPELRVAAPSGAEILLDGRRVGSAPWRTDTVSPGEHRVSASMSTIPGCPSARDDTLIRVRESGRTVVALSPRPCGSLVLDIPTGAHWAVAAPDGTEAASGTAPVERPVVLPVGAYTLRVTASYCADYRGEIEIAPGSPRHERVRLICG